MVCTFRAATPRQLRYARRAGGRAPLPAMRLSFSAAGQNMDLTIGVLPTRARTPERLKTFGLRPRQKQLNDHTALFSLSAEQDFASQSHLAGRLGTPACTNEIKGKTFHLPALRRLDPKQQRIRSPKLLSPNNKEDLSSLVKCKRKLFDRFSLLLWQLF